MSKLDDNYQFGKLRLSAFRFGARCDCSTSSSRYMNESNHHLKSIDLVEISRSVVESSKMDPSRSNYMQIDEFLYFWQNKFVSKIVPGVGPLRKVTKIYCG